MLICVFLRTTCWGAMPIYVSSVANNINFDTSKDMDCNEGSCTAHNVQPGDMVFVTHRFDSTINVSLSFYLLIFVVFLPNGELCVSTGQCVKRLKSTFIVILRVVSLKRTTWQMCRELFHEPLLYWSFAQAVTRPKRCLRRDFVS